VPPRRIPFTDAAELAGVTVATLRQYRRIPERYSPEPFPEVDADGTISVRELKAWLKSRPGRGGAGTAKARDPEGYACDRCGTKVQRRRKHEVPGKDPEFLCVPCWVAADPGNVR
jgi:hypothetical protein